MKVTYSNILRIASMLGLMLCLCHSLSAQNLYQLAAKPELKVMGGSTLHDWEMVASTASGKAAMTIDDQGIQAIHMAEVTMKSTALKSGNGKMDEIAYKALQTGKNPDIHFRLITFKNLGGNRASVTGNLTIAGTTKPVIFEVYYLVKKQVVELTGETSFRMTDFGVSPPTAMLGAIRTADNIKISFKANFNRINPL
jgi:polyisoprenoid-binding protein YceI